MRRAGKRRQGRFLTLCFARGEVEDAPPRVGFSVSKRIGDAVRRNQVKRRLREAIRRRLWNVALGWDMIVIARPDAATADYGALRDDVDALLKQARVLREPGRDSEINHRSASVTTSETISETPAQ